MNKYLFKRPEGLYFEPGDFYLDPKRVVQKAVITHGHADHAIAGNKAVWCTAATKSIMRLRYPRMISTLFTVPAYGEPFYFNEVKVTLLPAGHILGSAQVIIEYGGIKYCYTGDFKLREDASCERFQVEPCDVLITETTFADPLYAHPPEQDELSKLEAYEKTNIVIGAYNLGKSQRITRLLTDRFPHRRVMVHPEATGFHKIYEQMGIKLGNWQPYSYQLFRRTTGNILIAPPRALSTYYRETGVITAFATGWKKSPFRAHFNFHLSDHADWQEILDLIRDTGARTIVAVHGDGTLLKSHLSKEFPDIEVIN
ncbi:MAG: MBL fold metallo-hydrolase [Bacteroidetes bacterium]|nr:MBL fold metallo-hydrolase [Bacteroidota bacterium]